MRKLTQRKTESAVLPTSLMSFFSTQKPVVCKLVVVIWLSEQRAAKGHNWQNRERSWIQKFYLQRKQAISKQDGAEFLADIKPQCGERGKVWLMGGMGWEWLVAAPTIPTPTLLLSLHHTVANSRRVYI